MAHLALAPDAGVPAVRDRARGTLRAGRSTNTRSRSPSSVRRLRRGRGREPARVVAHGVPRRGDPDRLARQPDGDLPVHRSGCAPTSTSTRRRRSCCAPTRPPATPGSPTTASCSRSREPTRTTTTSSPSGGRSPTHPRSPRPATAALDAAGIGIDDIARFDLYSCFPSAVQIAMRALGLAGPAASDPRPLTVTGGLAYAGGPGNDYVTHSIAAMVEACRNDPGSVGLVTALGWYVTKHSVGLYSSRPSQSFARADTATVQAVVDATPAREVAGELRGSRDARGHVGRLRARRHSGPCDRCRAHGRRASGPRDHPRRRDDAVDDRVAHGRVVRSPSRPTARPTSSRPP